MDAEKLEFRSSDGTNLACWRSGTGPPLVLVHGTTANHERWQSVQGPLSRYFTTYAIDRRGYGGSGDGEGYSLQQEFEDIAAVVDAIGQPTHLLGHSFGALCALGASMLTDGLLKMVLYEPAISTGAPIYPSGVLARMQSLLDAGEHDELVVVFMTDMVGLAPAEVEEMRGQPFWKTRMEAAPAILRESYAEEGFRLEQLDFKDMKTPTLLLQGGDSPDFLKQATQAVLGVLPDSRIEVMPGQQHMAMTAAPELFVEKVLDFLLE